jgi:hypothetical protein
MTTPVGYGDVVAIFDKSFSENKLRRMIRSISGQWRFPHQSLKMMNRHSIQTHLYSIRTQHSPKSSISHPSTEGLRWKPVPSFSFSFYKDLTKAKLSAFVVLTTMAGYAVAPNVLNLSTLFWTTVGTGLCVASANAINQWIEGKERDDLLLNNHRQTSYQDYTLNLNSSI